MKKQILTGWLIIIIAILAIAAIAGFSAYQYFKAKNQYTIPQQIQNGKTETVDWKTFFNTKYGYNLKYPSNLQSPVSFCGGLLIDTSPAETCGDIGIKTTSGNNYTGIGDDYIKIQIFDNPKKIPLGVWVAEVLSKAKIQKPIIAKQISGKSFLMATFAGPLDFYPDDKQSGETYEAGTLISFVEISKNQIMRVIYSSSSEEKNKLYEDILSTFTFTK